MQQTLGCFPAACHLACFASLAYKMQPSFMQQNDRAPMMDIYQECQLERLAHTQPSLEYQGTEGSPGPLRHSLHLHLLHTLSSACIVDYDTRMVSPIKQVVHVSDSPHVLTGSRDGSQCVQNSILEYAKSIAHEVAPSSSRTRPYYALFSTWIAQM
jgi:hypothetical protein